MNKTGQIAVEIFNDLDRRLKSTDKKDIIGEEPEVRGHGPQHREKQKTKRKGNRPPDNKTVSSIDVYH